MRRPAFRPLLVAMLVVATGSGVAGVWAFSSADAPAKTEQYQMRAISRAVFADGRLWMMSDDGSLLSLGPSQLKPERVKTEGKLSRSVNPRATLLPLFRPINAIGR